MLTKRVDRRDVRETHRGCDAERQRGGHRDRQGKTEHDGIESDLIETRDRIGANALQDPDADSSQGESRQPAEAGEHQALDEKLAEEPAAAGAERRARRQFVDASGRAREHEVGDVHAYDQEHEPDRDQRQVQRAPRRRDGSSCSGTASTALKRAVGKRAFIDRLGLAGSAGACSGAIPCRNRRAAVRELFCSYVSCARS